MAHWLTLEELATYLKKGRSTIYRMVKDNLLPAQKVGRTWRFDRDEVDDWIKRKQAGVRQPLAKSQRPSSAFASEDKP